MSDVNVNRTVIEEEGDAGPVANIGGGAVVGGIAGALVGGPVGAAAGAAIGAGMGGTAEALDTDHDVEVTSTSTSTSTTPAVQPVQETTTTRTVDTNH